MNFDSNSFNLKIKVKMIQIWTILYHFYLRNFCYFFTQKINVLPAQLSSLRYNIYPWSWESGRDVYCHAFKVNTEYSLTFLVVNKIFLLSEDEISWEHFRIYSRGCKPQENLWNCSRKYTKMIKTDSFLGNKKLSLSQNVWRDHATMQQDVLLHFWVIFLH